MAVFKCKMCGGALEITGTESVITCDYCGSRQTLPRLDDDRRNNLYDRANHFRRNNEFDKAIDIYEKILNEDTKDAEAYWSLVLCKYGIEYVEDPSTKKRIPTVNRAQYTSILADENYKAALANADVMQRSIYEAEAKQIDEIQKGILAISQKEEPFDVFICYKETDEHGQRTRDSVLANDLYHQLTQEGFKVFFSHITLEDKLGTAYEPYIFAALQSAQVMVVLGTKKDYFNAAWVKNEWSRFLALIKEGKKKTLIPAYKDMDAYDLPEEFSHLQALDVSKLGFMQDLLRGIRKIVAKEEPKPATKETVVVNNGSGANTQALLKRAFMFLEDGDWRSADEYCDKVLDNEPENARAYLGKLMAELHVYRQDGLKNVANPFDQNNHYKKVLRFADEPLAATMKQYIVEINERNELSRLNAVYTSAVKKMNSDDEEQILQARKEFQSIPGYKDANALAKQCVEKAEIARKDGIYDLGVCLMKDAAKDVSDGEFKYYDAADKFESIPGYKDADALAQKCFDKAEESRNNKIYFDAIAFEKNLPADDDERIAAYKGAISELETIPGWRDADEKVIAYQQKIKQLQYTIAAEYEQRLKLEKRKKTKKRVILSIYYALTAVAVFIGVTFFLYPNVIYPRLPADDLYTPEILQTYNGESKSGSEYTVKITECNKGGNITAIWIFSSRYGVYGKINLTGQITDKKNSGDLVIEWTSQTAEVLDGGASWSDEESATITNHGTTLKTMDSTLYAEGVDPDSIKESRTSVEGKIADYISWTLGIGFWLLVIFFGIRHVIVRSIDKKK